MRIRTQIILAAFVLAVVPLAAIVTYSYHSSRRALESAYGREAERLTRQMDRRLATIRADLDERLAVVSALPIETATSGDVGTSIATVMGEAASFVDSIEFQPVRVTAAPRPEPEPEATPADAPADAPAAPEIALRVAPPPPAPPPAAIVIEMPPMPAMPHFRMSEEAQELIAEVSKLGGALGDASLDAAEREDLEKELNTAQGELRRVIDEERKQYEQELEKARSTLEFQKALAARVRAQRPRTAPAAMVAPTPNVEATPAVEVTPKVRSSNVNVRKATDKDVQSSATSAKKTSLLLGRKFEAPVRTDGKLIGQITARVSPEQVIRRILGGATGADDEGSEIPFALDREGTVYTRNQDERAKLEAMSIPQRVKKGESLKDIHGWIVSTSTDPQSGLRIGVARPVGENLDELQRTAGRNFGLGLGLIFVAMIGIVPLSNHLMRDVKLVTDGAERIAHGDLMTRLPVKSDNEMGQLARAFNRMAEDLSVHQQKLVEQERAQKEQELQQRLMTVEFERKTVELEDARRFQLSMLPKELPQHPAYDVAVYTRTATEVGGDYYDFHLVDDSLSVTIGDATGHGAKAGTMVTVIKTLFAGYGGAMSPAGFLSDAAEKIKRMDLGRMAMALSLGRFARRTLTLSSAGMPPVLVHRAATSAVEELALSATPLGTLGTTYEQIASELASGDTVLFLSDGFPELMNDAGQQLGYAAALDAFAEAARGENAAAVIESLETFAKRWHGDLPPNDDVTFVVVRV